MRQSTMFATGQIPYWNSSQEMFAMEKVLNSSQYISKDSLQFWYPKFYQDCCVATKDYCVDPTGLWADSKCSQELGFKRKLLLFLKENQYFYHDLRFNVSFEAMSEERAFDHFYNGDFTVTASRAKFQHNELKNTSIKTKAMEEVKAGLAQIKLKTLDSSDKDENFLPSPVAYSIMYIQWEANDIISDELIRNISLTFATIAIVSLILIIDLRVCGLVFLSVVFSVTNVCGYAYFMGLTIEIVTSIQLILSVGLALDYAAHVGVIFACLKQGTREEKMKLTLE